MFRFVCFYCQKVLKTREDKVGVIIHCPRCKKPLQVPAPPGQEKRVLPPLPPGVQMARPAPPRKPWLGKLLRPLIKPAVAAGVIALIGFGAVKYTRSDKPSTDETQQAKDDAKEKKDATPSPPPPPPKKKEVPEYIVDLGGKDATLRLEAAAALEKDGLGGKDAIKPFVAILQDKSKSDDAVLLKRFAASALGKIGAKLDAKLQEDVAKELRDAVRDDNQEVRFLALEGLGKLRAVALPFLRECLADRNKDTKIKTAAVLAGMGDIAKPLAPDIYREITLADAATKITLAAHLVKLDPANENLIPILLDGLRTSDNKVKITAAKALGEMGKTASSTANALYDVAIKDRDNGVKAAAADALEKVRDDK